MESIVIKMHDQYYQKDSDIKKLIRYIAGETEKKEKTRYCNGRGLPCNCKKASKAIIEVQKGYRKDSQRRIYHLFVSFPDYVTDANYVKLVAESIADMLYEKHQIYYGVHEDTDNLHIHFAINAVSYVDGRKWHQSKKEFEKMKKEIQKIEKKIHQSFI